MQSLTAVDHEMPPGYHFARIVAYSLSLPYHQRIAVQDSARLLLERGDLR